MFVGPLFCLVCAHAQTKSLVTGIVTIRGKDTRSLRLLLRTMRKGDSNLAETIASDGSYHLEGDAPPESLFVTLSARQVGYAGGPWKPSSNNAKLDIEAVRLTGKAVKLTPEDCANVLLSAATTCALLFDFRDPVPLGAVLNSRIALDREQSANDSDILQKAAGAARKSSVPASEAWLHRIERELKRTATPLPNYLELDPEASLTRLQTLTGDAAMCEAMLALSFDCDEFLPNWRPDIIAPKFAEWIGVEGVHPATVEYQITDLTDANPVPTPMLSFRRDRGIRAEDLQAWISQSPTARLYVFRLAVSMLAKDETVRKRARALLPRYKPRLRINL